MKTLPLNLVDLATRRCVVIGGAGVAGRKVTTLWWLRARYRSAT
jgi:siroheme synthase (precorrin-2 oxidase/ferrochelatase)